MLLTVVFAGCAVLIRRSKRPASRHIHQIPLVVFSVSLLALVPVIVAPQIGTSTAITASLVPPIRLLPFAIAPLLGTILAGETVGLSLGLWTGVSCALLMGLQLPEAGLGFLVAPLAIYLGRRVRSRASIFQAGLLTAVAATAVFSVHLIETAGGFESGTAGSRHLLMLVAGGTVSGIIMSLVILVAVPLFESLFHVTPDIRLLELSDLGHPLLQRLALEAPGTYHHSLVVANLVQAAAGEIGANSLLSRVCAYFHDVGKLTKPGYYSENLQQGPNPHDDLQPSMSALVIVAHVKEGVGLAVAHGLPELVTDAIRQHHGTSLVSYFHQKALRLEKEQAGQSGDSEINESDFRYPGPRPASREMAILMLADSVEAASRSLDKTTPRSLQEAVDAMVNAKLMDGQLDECRLTLEELSRIRKSFVFALTSMLHGRIAYPKNENIDKQQAEAVQGEPSQDRDTR